MAEVRSWRGGWLGVDQPTFLPQFPPTSPKFLHLFSLDGEFSSMHILICFEFYIPQGHFNKDPLVHSCLSEAEVSG